jgi:two-component system, NtrC family, response regulator HydG
MSGGERTWRILVVDDSAQTVEVITRTLTALGYQVRAASGAADALACLAAEPADIVVTDFRMPGVDGMELTRHIRENHGGTEVVMITGYGSIDHAVSAMKIGAAEYLAKPFTEEELAEAVGRARDRLALRLPGTAARQEDAPGGLLGASAPMAAVYRLIRKAAPVSAPVLITGESGTGKEMVARAIHYTGARAAAPFVAVNCGAIPETLIESELFGYARGAFTGADQARAGHFQTAEGGTLFLDEISETSPAMQVKLLRAVQDGEVAMIGGRKSLRVDVRVIAATNKELSALVQRGTFREDLYYRLNVISIPIPPLRERNDDLLLLIRHFTRRYSRQFGTPEPVFSEQALRALLGHDWPGNVRELENVVQRTLLLCEGGTVTAADLPEALRYSAAAPRRLDRPLAEVEAEYVAAVLASVGGNRSRAARILGIDRKTLAARLSRGGPFTEH